MDIDKSNDNSEIEKLKLALKVCEEKLEDHNKKSEFFANISHEFKTPINILMGAMQLIELYTLSGTIKDPEKKLEKYMKTMKQNSLRLLKLINNIISMTKIDSNDVSIELHNYDIVTIIKNVVQSIEAYAKVKLINLTLETNLDKKIIACDADKIERIMLNLLSNAIKFSNKQGNIKIKLEDINNMVSISVEDDGIGIPKDKLNSIFQRFRKVETSFTRNREGSGLGLSIVKALVEMHNGTINVTSEYTKGSKFVIQLPNRKLSESNKSNLYSQFDDDIDQRVKVEFSDIQDIF
ncbi:sensor histidine kinase [Candidatus Clostridium stratigraminis]|uniref:histidine kinase n=1 Tax=Candidatus Clostridium stratigraminis TaxID=3381661 RepID=A0ABW8T5R8_9CLOT